jgi:raffinose/stachyose/melibiose transport system substrate-binding protein
VTNIKKYLPLIAITAAFFWSMWAIGTRRAAETPKDAIIIRIGHWQLESSVREGFDKMAREFAARPDIKAKYGNVIVVQDAIPETVYGQWASSQMMGRTAPDIVEIGLGLPQPIWLGYLNRYFIPLTDLANEPNPFNKGTPLESVPFRHTFTDDMRRGYTEELQQYTSIPLSRFTTRLFYNKTLLKKLTGKDAPPSDFRGFLALCDEIKKHHDERGQAYMPIACSAYHMAAMWVPGLFNILTYGNLWKADFNRDGTVGSDEFYAAIRTGAMTFNDPPNRAKFQMTAEMLPYFQDGFTGLNRDDAVFAFAQQRAVFISTGTWDALSLYQQAQGDDPAHPNFELGLMDYPFPTPNDPEFGKLIVGPKYDQALVGFPMGVTNFSKHPDVAKDFLRFLCSVDGNREFNKILGWIPSVRGVPLPPMLAKFAPREEGMYACYNTDLGGQTVVRYMQDYSEFETNRAFTYEDLFKKFAPYYKEQGLADWEEQQRDWRRAILINEQFLASLRGEALLAGNGREATGTWVRYRSFTMRRQITPEIGRAIQERLVRHGPDRPVGPYEYLPSALEKLRRHLAAAPSTQRSNP